MRQTFIIRSDMHPNDALKSGDDKSVCGDCLARPANEGFCYVNVSRSVASVYRAFLRGRYVPSNGSEEFRGAIVRLGAYGDPGAVPVSVWYTALEHAESWNGYSHQWRTMPELREFCMASCDTARDYLDAKAAGWRTFRVRLASDPLYKDTETAYREVTCPASAEAGHKTTCASCKACGGLSAKAKADVAIVAHGATGKRYGQWRERQAA